MENKPYFTNEKNDFMDTLRTQRSRQRNGQIYVGAFIIIAGTLMLLDRMGLPVPHWMLSWEMLLIGIGLVMGLKNGFRDISWLIPVGIGTIFLAKDVIPELRFGNLVWPMIIMLVGFVILVKGNRFRAMDDTFNPPPPRNDIATGFRRMDDPAVPGVSAGEANAAPADNVMPDDQIECTAIFGGVKRAVVSKNFMGGEIVAIFGGAEIDLTHADINGVVKIEATNILGGTKLIVPPTWDVQSEMVAVFGGVEDKRRIQPELINRNKRLVLMGTAFLGGLEIKSF